MSIKRVFTAGLVFAGVVIAHEASAQSGCFSHRCSPTANNFWPMMHTDNTTCPSSHPSDAVRFNFAHGQGFFRVTLSSDFNILGSVPCVNPGLGIPLCSDPGKTGFIYATDPFNERITDAEFASRQPYICDDGVIHPGSAVYTPASTPTETPTATPTPTPTLIPTWGEVEGDSVEARYGVSVAPAGDVNGDGYPDVIVGAEWLTNGHFREGRAYVYPGSARGLLTVPIWTAEVNQHGAVFGHSVASAGDVNGDGYDDVIVGAQGYDNGQEDEGAAFLYLGSSTGISSSPAWQGESNQAAALYGWSVSSAGDLNNDGYDDVVISAKHYDYLRPDLVYFFPGLGRAYVYYGSAAGLPTTPSWTFDGEVSTFGNGGQFGSSVSRAGDVDRDGFDDVIIGANSFDNCTGCNGVAYLFRGSATGLSSSYALRLSGNRQNNLDDPTGFGGSVASAGDVNGDGYDDVVIGAAGPGGGSTEGAYVFAGSASGLQTIPLWKGRAEMPYTRTDLGYGASVASAGDVNKDGYSDVIVGAGTFSNNEIWEGAAFLYLGSASGLSMTAAWRQESNQEYGYYGVVASTGDVNKDGYSDVIVGAWEIANTQYSEGRAYFYSDFRQLKTGGATGDTPTNTTPSTPTETATYTPADTATSTATAVATVTASYTARSTPQDSATATHTATAIPQDTATVAFTATATPPNTATVTYTATATPQDTATATLTATSTPQDSATATHTPGTTLTAVPTTKSVNTAISTVISTPADTLTDTPTNTPTYTAVDTPSVTPTGEPVGSVAPTPLGTPTISATSSLIPSFGDPDALECTDLIDNDGDGLTDSLDPDCQYPGATRESGSTTFAVSLEGIYDNKDGTFVAYFSYKNDSGKVITAPRGDSPTTRNVFSPEPASRAQPSDFLPGEHRGVYRVEFKGSLFVWTIKAPGFDEIQIPVSSESPKLPAVKPVSDCINKSETGGFLSVWGYNNPNDFEIVIPVGPRNAFVPGKVDRAQPDKFFAGLNRGAFSLPLNEILEWKLAGTSASASPKVNVCTCPSTNNTTSKEMILKFSQELGVLVYEVADQIEQASKARFAGAPADVKKRLREGIQRTRRRAAEAALQAQDLSSSLPILSRSCPDVPVGCRQVDDGATLEKLRKYHYDTLALIKRMNARSDFIERGRTKRNEEIVRRATKLFKRGLSEINRIPRFRTVCKENGTLPF